MAAVDLYVQPDSSPCPSIRVELSGLTGVKINARRNAGGKRAYVRGFKGRTIVGDTYTLTDYEAPFGVAVTYEVECFNASNVSLSKVTSGAAVLEVADPWISDPLNPGTSTMVVVGGDSLTQSTLRRSGGLIVVNDGSLPVLQGGVRRVGGNIPLIFMCGDEAEETRVLDVLRAADPFLLRTPPGYRQLPRLAYVTSDEWVVEVAPRGGGADIPSKIRGSLDQVEGPGVTIQVPVRTYGHVKASHPTYADLLVVNADYLSVLRG